MKTIYRLRVFITRILQVATTRLLRIVIPLFVTLEYKGISDIDHSRRYLFISNHRTYFDVYAIFIGMSIKDLWRCSATRFMTAAQIYYSPLLPFIALGGGYPTRKSRGGYSAVHQSITYLHSGQNVVIFPEGRRVRHEKTNPHSGVTRIIHGITDDDLDIILVHLDWEVSLLRRRLRVVHRRYHGDTSPKAIMDAIYSL